MVASSDWFRSPDWDEQARAEFNDRLARAKLTNRPQYLRIKALTLRNAGQTDVARELLRRLVDAYPDSLDYGFALELLGDLARAHGASVEAEAYYRRLLSEKPDLKATTGMVEVSLAEVLIERGDRANALAALRLLEAVFKRQKSWFNDQLYRWQLALAEIAQLIGEAETMQTAARTAIRLTREGPQLPRHPTVGVVHADDATLQWLQDAADGRDPGLRPHR
jgi:predicted Zn-dependent protease